MFILSWHIQKSVEKWLYLFHWWPHLLASWEQQITSPFRVGSGNGHVLGSEGENVLEYKVKPEGIALLNCVLCVYHFTVTEAGMPFTGLCGFLTLINTHSWSMVKWRNILNHREGRREKIRQQRRACRCYFISQRCPHMPAFPLSDTWTSTRGSCCTLSVHGLCQHSQAFLGDRPLQQQHCRWTFPRVGKIRAD